MAATLEKLMTVRSQKAEAMLAYLRAMEAELVKNPLLDRFQLRLDDLRVPLRVVPHEPVRDIEDIRAREHFRQTGASRDEDADETVRRVYAHRRGLPIDEDKASRPRPEPLDELEPKLDMAVILGDPGSGKTEWSKSLARRAAKEARELLEGFAISLDELPFPAYLRLRDVGTALAKENELRDWLVKTGCPAAQTDAELAAAAILKALVQHHQLPIQLAPWVWGKLTAQRQAGAKSPALLCLDAWDEVRSGQEELARSLDAFAKTTSCRIFLTSRIIGYTPGLLPVENKTEGPRCEWLSQTLNARDENRRKIAAGAVGSIGGAAATPAILAQLARLLEDGDWDVRRAAAEAVWGIGGAAATPAFLAHLARLLEDRDRYVRGAAAKAVRQMMAQGVRILEREDGTWEARTVEGLANL